MSGLLRRIRRPGAAEETRTEPIPAPEPAHGTAPAPTAAAGERPAPADGRPLPAGAGPEDLERRGAAGRRGKLRRRVRFLRRARELALRDLGGLVYEARRRDHDGGALVEDKVRRLAALDGELRGLESELGAPPGATVLREPGVGGSCPRCGELHASDARFCSSCGLDLTAPAAEPAASDAPAAAAEPATTDAPAAAAEPATSDAPAAAAEPATSDAPAAAAEPAASDAPGAPGAQEATPAEPAANGRSADTAETAVHADAAAAETPDRPA